MLIVIYYCLIFTRVIVVCLAAVIETLYELSPVEILKKIQAPPYHQHLLRVMLITDTFQLQRSTKGSVNYTTNVAAQAKGSEDWKKS